MDLGYPLYYKLNLEISFDTMHSTISANRIAGLPGSTVIALDGQTINIKGTVPFTGTIIGYTGSKINASNLIIPTGTSLQ